MVCTFTGLLHPSAAGEVSANALKEIRAARDVALERQRRVIFNNDGCDATHLAKEPTVEAFLQVRSYGLKGSQVDSIFYCPISAGFGLFTHRTEVGEILTTRNSFLKNNITADLIEQGTDPLQIIIDFSRENDYEIFFSMRMNDTHDVAYRPEEEVPYPLMPQLKLDRPDLLFGAPDNRPPHGRWSAVDYGQPEIRELAFRYLEEVCQNYDIDGLELDFFRHMQLFKTAAWEGEATEAERQIMTELMRRIRTMTEIEGIKRDKPILIAIRVPDSVEYSRRVGIDLEAWLQEGLVDILITSCYFRLNDWDYSIKLGHKYGVKVYPGLSESRIRETDVPAGLGRRSDKSYRGRAAAAWAAGADGIYVFNEYRDNRRYLRDIGEPESLRGMDKVYYPSIRGVGGAGSWIEGGETFINKSVLNPLQPVNLSSAEPYTADIYMMEDFETTPPTVVLTLSVAGITNVNELVTQVNGHRLGDGKLNGGQVVYAVDSALLHDGVNRFTVATVSSPAGEETESLGWNMEYQGDVVMAGASQLPWRRAFHPAEWTEEIRDGYFYFADNSSTPQSMAHLAYPWNLDRDARTVIEARVKVDDSTDPLGVSIRIANGEVIEYFTLEQERISLLYTGLEHPMTTNDDFHTYRIEMQGGTLSLWVDGVKVFDVNDGFGKDANNPDNWISLAEGLQGWNRNSLMFGSFTDPGTGGAWWDFIRYRTDSAILNDLRLEVNY